MTDAPGGSRTTADDARRWLARMPANVTRQRHLLESLVTAAEAEPAFRWLELGGSLGRGAGDELSDIDAGLGIADDQWTAGLAAAEAATRAADPVADAFRQRYPGKDGQPCWHLFTLYDSGLQLSLVVMPASWRAGLPPVRRAVRHRWPAGHELDPGQRRGRCPHAAGMGLSGLGRARRPRQVP